MAPTTRSRARPERAAPAPHAAPPSFVAIDFETADSWPDRACSIGLVRVEAGRIAGREHVLIRPPRPTFQFTDLHGIALAHVAGEPSFAERWPELAARLEGAEFLAAHNAAFDSRVLRACCEAVGLEPPAVPSRCAVALARRTWGIYPTRLPDVCRHLGLELRHHDALSDAEACAHIVLAAHGQRAR